MKKILLFNLLVILLAFACKKEAAVSPIAKMPKLLLTITTTSNGKVEEQCAYEYDTQRRLVKEICTLPQYSLCEYTYGTNKMFLKCPVYPIDWDYTIINGLVNQRLDKITNVRREYEYDPQQHLIKRIQYDASGKVKETISYIYNADGNNTDEIISGGTNIKYEYSNTILNTVNHSTYGVPMFGAESKNAVTRATLKNIQGVTLTDYIYAYETDTEGYVIKKITTDVLNPNQQARTTVYTYQ